MNKTKKRILPKHSNEIELANKFANFYKQKIIDIRKNLTNNNNSYSNNNNQLSNIV